MSAAAHRAPSLRVADVNTMVELNRNIKSNSQTDRDLVALAPEMAATIIWFDDEPRMADVCHTVTGIAERF